MSKRTAMMLAALIALALPAPALAQIGIGARIGTIGIGAEASIGIGSMIGLRAGMSVMPVELDQDIDDIGYALDLPSMWNVGIDFYPTGGGFRLSAGLLSRKEIDMQFRKTGTQRVGNRDYTGTITIDGTLTNEQEIAPYAAVGFGRTFASGLGIFMDFGAARMGAADIQLVGSCQQSDGSACPEFPPNLDAEEQQAEDKAGGFIEWHPIIQIGLKFGLGR